MLPGANPVYAAIQDLLREGKGRTVHFHWLDHNSAFSSRLIDREIELPAGAIRLAPLEETAQGTIVFPLSQWSGRPVLSS